MPDETDARKILVENWRRSPGRPYVEWMKTIQQDLKSNNLSLNEANSSNWHGSESSTLETDVYVWHYAVVFAKKEKKEDMVFN